MKKAIDRKKQKIIYIKWHDAFSDGGWKTPEQVSTLINSEYCLCENIGWLIFEDAKEICISSRRLAWETKPEEATFEYGLFQKIPKTWIVKRKYL